MNQPIENHIQTTSENWAERWIAGRMAKLSKGKRGSATGKLKKSMGFQVVKRGDESIVASIEFEDYGRFLDMVRLNYSHDAWGRNAFLRLEEWIRQKGLARFVPGFVRKYGKVPARESAFINRVAWGIMKSRTDKFKRVSWYAKAKGGGVNDLFNRVAAGLPDIAIDQIKQNLTKKN